MDMAVMDLFRGSLPRRPRRVLMTAVDIGQAPGMMPEWQTSKGAHWVCSRCGHDAGWLFNMSNTEIRNKVACPVCSPGGDRPC